MRVKPILILLSVIALVTGAYFLLKPPLRLYRHKTTLAKRIKRADVVLTSFPKSGRTWVRYFLARYVEKAYDQPFSLDLVRTESTPAVWFSHNYFDFQQNTNGTPEIYHQHLLHQKKLVILLRDPRDVLVSYYHHKHDRNSAFHGTLNEFALSEVYGIERQSQFVLALLNFYRDHNDQKILLTYSQLKKNAPYHFKRLVEFVYGSFNAEAFYYALNSSQFDKMRKYEVTLSQQELEDAALSKMGQQNWDGNQDALKVRKGVVGGYLSEMDEELIEQINQLPATQELISELELRKY